MNQETPPKVGPSESETRMWSMFIHLSMLLGFVVPVAGYLVPIIIWQIKKDEMPAIDEHGKEATNWMISEFIYLCVSGVLCIILIGIPMIFALLAMGVIFPVVAALKANNGEHWRYPMTIRFLK